jgi:hypothetical protein
MSQLINPNQRLNVSPTDLVLEPASAQSLSAAVIRYRELTKSAIINPRDEAEIVGLQKFLLESMINYGGNLIGCWVAVKQEYEPLLRSLALIGNRLKVMTENRTEENNLNKETAPE